MRSTLQPLLLAAALGLAAVPVSVPAFAASVTLTPVKDNTLYEDASGELSNGAGFFFFSGVTQQSFIRRGVLAFDIASVVPEGATISRATLTLQMSMTLPSEETHTLHRLLADWGESTSDAPLQEGAGTNSQIGDASWIHTFFSSAPWTTAGGDFIATPSASRSVDDIGPYTWGSTAGLVADVQLWLDTPAQNFGWILIGNESVKGTAKRFNTREHSNEATRPQLKIDFGFPIFSDGFESGDTTAWSATEPFK